MTIAQEAINAFTSPTAVFLLTGIVLSVVLKRAWIGYSVGVASLLLAAILVLFGDMGEVGVFAIREGCITGYPIDELMFAAMGLIGVASGWKTYNARNIP